MKAILCVRLREILYKSVHYCLERREQTGSNQDRKSSGRPRCVTVQEDMYIRVSGLRNRHLTGLQLAVSLNSTRQTSASSATVKRQLWVVVIILIVTLSVLFDQLMIPL
uniref:Uncharacterized protein n=1 Tax=Anguilla anguilla TaxID=7936 RepID=A0A0E9UEL1_ANGAN